MGMFDLYCHVCSLPFTPLMKDKFKEKTKWLNNAVCKYTVETSTGKQTFLINLCDYDDYGSFEIVGELPEELKNNDVFQNNIEYDRLCLVELDNYGDVCHSSCLHRKDKKKALCSTASNYCDQFFDEKGFLKNKELIWLLDEPK